MKRLWIMAALVMTWANSAGAAVFVTFTGAAPESPGIWDWTYLVTLQPDQNMRVGDFATIYDVPNIANPSVFNPTFGVGPDVLGHTFDITTPFTGLTPGAPLADDDGTIRNVSLQLAGCGNILGPPTLGPITVGTLHIKNPTDQSIITAHLTLAEAGGGDSTNPGTVQVAVPEPGSLTLMF